MIDNKIKNTIKYPTSLVINGVSNLGLELASSLLEQGGYVILVDAVNENNFYKIVDSIGENALVSFIDYADIPYLEEDIRRLDYTFYLQHEVEDPYATVSTQAFLRMANYLDAVLALNVNFEAKFLLATSLRASYELMRLEFDSVAAHASRTQPLYLEMDIHKYAESLTLEYVEKADLAGRVVRVGEIIGDGLDLGKNTVFNRLLVQAVRGEKLQVPGDGLDTEYYVHLLDSAYGIIKAQFSPQTVGQVYSIAYDVPITNLSIAYRLQELEPNARDIEFGQETGPNTGNSLRLQRKAASLSKLGWQPRIEFDQAVSESIVAAKSANLDKIIDFGNDESGFLGKVKSFLAIAQQPEEASMEEEIGGNPVSRLIAERQHQERVRAQSFDRADDYLKQRRQTRDLTFGEKLQNFIWRQFQKIQSSFSFLSETTPAQFFLGIIFTLVLIFLYFGLFSPVLVLARNGIILSESIDGLALEIQSNDFVALEATTSRVTQLVGENEQMLGRLRDVTAILGTAPLFEDALEINGSYKLMADGAAELSFATRPLGDYLNSYTNNLRYRGNADNYIGIGNTSSYGASLSLLRERSAFLDTGKEKLSLGIEALRSLGDDNFFSQYLGSINSKIISEAERVDDFADAIYYLPEILAVDSEKRYLIMLLDNTRPMPLGGEIAAVAELAVKEGAIVDAKVVTAESIDLSAQSLPTFTSEIYATKSPEVNFSSLDETNDNLILADALDSAWRSYYGTELNGVVLITTSGLEAMLPERGSEQFVNVEGVDFDNTNLISKLNALQGSAGAARRNDLLAQLLAHTLVSNLDSLTTAFDDVVRDLAALNRAENLLFTAADPALTPLVLESGTDGQQSNREADVNLEFYVVADPRISNADRYPNLTQSSLVEIAADGTILYESVLRFPSVNNISSAIACLPAIATNIEVVGFTTTEYSVKKVSDGICLNLPTSGINEVALKWQVSTLARDNENEYNLSLAFSKPTGIDMTSNVEVQLASNLDLTALEPQVSVVANQFGLTENLSQDQIINLYITK